MPPKRDNNLTTIVTPERARVVLNMPCFSISDAMRPGIMLPIIRMSKEKEEMRKYDFSTINTPNTERSMAIIKRRLP